MRRDLSGKWGAQDCLSEGIKNADFRKLPVLLVISGNPLFLAGMLYKLGKTDKKYIAFVEEKGYKYI